MGDAGEQEQLLLDTYNEIREATWKILKPGVTVSDLDAVGAEVCVRHDLEQYHINGVSHGIGLRFEEIRRRRLFRLIEKRSYGQI